MKNGIHKSTLMLALVIFMVIPQGVMANALMKEFNGKTYSPEPPQTIRYTDTSWTPWNIGMFSFMVAGSAMDVYSTQDVLDGGGMELNPIYGEDPSTGRLIATKIVYIGIVYLITEYWMVPTYGTSARNLSYGIAGAIGTGAAIWNMNQ